MAIGRSCIDGRLPGKVVPRDDDEVVELGHTLRAAASSEPNARNPMIMTRNDAGRGLLAEDQRRGVTF